MLWTPKGQHYIKIVGALLYYKATFLEFLDNKGLTSKCFQNTLCCIDTDPVFKTSASLVEIDRVVLFAELHTYVHIFCKKHFFELTGPQKRIFSLYFQILISL